MINEDQLSAYEWLASPMWVFHCKQMNITWANQAAMRFWQADSMNELRGRSFEASTRVTQERLARAHSAALSGICQEEYWTLYPGGEAKEVLLQSNIVVDAKGDADGLLFCANNLKSLPNTDRCGVQALLYTPMLVGLYKSTGEFLYRNPAATKTWGPGDASIRFGENFVDSADIDRILAHIGNGEIFRGDCEMKTDSGVKMFEVTCHPGINPLTGDPAIGISATDVTEHKSVERERDLLRESKLREAQADALSERQRTIRARKQFMATASHEQRTPLQTVVSCIDRIEQDPRDVNRCLEELKEAAEQLIRINEDLVEFIRNDSAPGPNNKIVRASELLEYALKPSRLAAQSKGLAFTLHSEGLDRNINIDEMRVRQVISNVVSNAIRYTKAGSIEVSASVLCESLQQTFVIRVRDTGIGMDEAYAEKIMLPFFRGPGSEATAPQGLGLGLAIVQSHLDELNGDLRIDSTLGVGTTVTVSIPCEFT